MGHFHLRLINQSEEDKLLAYPNTAYLKEQDPSQTHSASWTSETTEILELITSPERAIERETGVHGAENEY